MIMNYVFDKLLRLKFSKLYLNIKRRDNFG